MSDEQESLQVNQTFKKTLIDWDLNIYMSEKYDQKKGEHVLDASSWQISAYAYRDGSHREWGEPIELTGKEIESIGFNTAERFRDEPDTWYGLAAFREDFGSRFSDRLMQFFDALPKHWEDLTDSRD